MLLCYQERIPHIPQGFAVVTGAVTAALLFRLTDFARILSTGPRPGRSHPVMQLPPSAMEFARIIGISATLRLADCAKSSHRHARHRSYRIRIPVGAMKDDHPIVMTIGRQNAELIHRHFSGETMAFPARRIRAISRDILIARDFTQGIPIPVLATSHKVSEQTVLRALGRVTTGDIVHAGPPKLNEQ